MRSQYQKIKFSFINIRKTIYSIESDVLLYFTSFLQNESIVNVTEQLNRPNKQKQINSVRSATHRH